MICGNLGLLHIDKIKHYMHVSVIGLLHIDKIKHLTLNFLIKLYF